MPLVIGIYTRFSVAAAPIVEGRWFKNDEPASGFIR